LLIPKVLTAFGDGYENITQLLAVALDKDSAFLEPFCGFIHQYVEREDQE